MTNFESFLKSASISTKIFSAMSFENQEKIVELYLLKNKNKIQKENNDRLEKMFNRIEAVLNRDQITE
jgi:hypothetical protein